jgi:hypothetical protein
MTQIYSRTFVSPLHERSSSYDKSRDHYTSREFPLPDTHPEKKYEGNGWTITQSFAPMSDTTRVLYEVPVPRAGDMYQIQPELSHKPAREQLPPLSSLFGSAPSQSRPAQSPYSDGHSPSFPAVSPQDSRQPATSVYPDRPFENSYFQRPPLSRHSFGSSRPEQVERLGFPPPPRPTQTGPGPESPRYDSRYGVDAARTPGSAPVNGWPHHSQPQPSRPEFLSRDTSSSFRAHPDLRHPPPPPSHRLESDPRAAYGEAPHSAPVTPSYPPTPASTVVGDANSTKDSLGPKIWTGTQFLPRFVRQAEVPGEGMCYFYDDGTHCKTVIDGEIVNAHWGVTKAGKPRKRLAIACITCREKKIKCDPDYPRCVQCEKFGRICKFKNAYVLSILPSSLRLPGLRQNPCLKDYHTDYDLQSSRWPRIARYASSRP